MKKVEHRSAGSVELMNNTAGGFVLVNVMVISAFAAGSHIIIASTHISDEILKFET